MPAEWQIKQLLLMGSAARPPGKMLSLRGKLALTECKVTPPPVTIEAAGAAGGVSAAGAG